MSKIHDWRRIKARRSYKVRELADLLEIGESAVYRWLWRGLPQLGSGRPALILGRDAMEYIKKLHKSYKRPCGPRELHCLRCKEPRVVANNVVELLPHSMGRAYLKANCSECGCTMFQIAKVDAVPERMPGVVVMQKVA